MSTNTIVVIVLVAVLFMAYSKKPASASGGTPTSTNSNTSGTNVPSGNSTGGITANDVGVIGNAAANLINAFDNLLKGANK